MSKSTGLIIDTPKVWELMCALDPHFSELSYEDNYGNYLILNLMDEEGHSISAIVTPGTFEKYFDHLTNDEPIRTYVFHKK